MAAGRGTSSANFTKKSFKVTTPQKISFLGMPNDTEWVLYGPELDKTLGMRNYLTYNLARASGHYATRTIYCEVFLVNSSSPLTLDHYNGVYIAEEKVKRSPDRVDIAKFNASSGNLSGGYIFLYDNDNIEQGDVTFGPLPGWDHPFLIKYPSVSVNSSSDKAQNQQAPSWLLSYLNDFQTTLYSFSSPQSTSSSYKSFIDFDEWVYFFLLVELTKSPDGYRGSTFMNKDKDGPLRMGPVWDYNEAYGECCGCVDSNRFFFPSWLV